MKTTYNGKEYELLSFDDAVAEFEKQEAKGVHNAIMIVENGYIVIDAVFRKRKQ